MKLTRNRNDRLRFIAAAITVLTIAFGSALMSAPAQAATRSCTAKTPTAKLPTLRSGDKGSCVVVAQKFFIGKGYRIRADGVFGATTVASTRGIQAAYRLPVTGVINTATWVKLRSVYNKYRGPNYTARVVLTYDDCPKTLPALKAMLAKAKALNIGLVLAPTGNCIKSFKSRYNVDVAAVMRSYGQYVINHSVTHPDLRKLSYAKIVKELKAPGVVTNFGRPPYGAVNTTVDKAYAAVGMREWIWNQDTEDWKGKTTAQVVASVIKSSRAGDTVLMHMQWNGFNPSALQKMKTGLAAKKLTVCPVYKGVTPVKLSGTLCR